MWQLAGGLRDVKRERPQPGHILADPGSEGTIAVAIGQRTAIQGGVRQHAPGKFAAHEGVIFNVMGGALARFTRRELVAHLTLAR